MEEEAAFIPDEQGQELDSSRDPVEGYSPIDSPETEDVENTVTQTEQHVEEKNGESSLSTSNRKRAFDPFSDDEEEVAEKRPHLDREELSPKEIPGEIPENTSREPEQTTQEPEQTSQEPEQTSQNTDEISPEPFDKDEDDSSEGPFGDDDLEDEDNENAFTNLVDEIDEDEEEEDGEAGELEEEGTEKKLSTDERKVSSDPEGEDEKKVDDSLSDFDVMMQRRKEAMARARKKRRKDIDINSVDDHIHAMLQQMKYAAEEDCRLNLKKKPAVKKLTMLPTVIAQLKKIDLVTSFIESGMCSALADWLKPLPDHSLPHLKIREDILDILTTFPEMDSHVLKTSGLGKAVMLVYRHPKETKKNREKAGRLINNWARPIFGLASDYKTLNRDEREERDWARLSQAAKRRLSSTGGGESSQSNQDESSESQKPGDKGWIPRARVPMPSHKDYVVRPKWNVDREIKKGSSKKTLNRYEKHIQKTREKQSRNKNTHAISISIEGRKMPL